MAKVAKDSLEEHQKACTLPMGLMCLDVLPESTEEVCQVSDWLLGALLNPETWVESCV